LKLNKNITEIYFSYSGIITKTTVTHKTVGMH